MTDIWDHREIGSLAERLEDYEQLLEELSMRVSDQDRILIRRTLDRVDCKDCKDCMTSARANISRISLPRLTNQQPPVAKDQVPIESRPGSTRLELELALPNRWIAPMKIIAEPPPLVLQDIMARIRR